MKLLHLFEQASDLQPGEKRVRPDIRIRNIADLEARISQLQDHIDQSAHLKHTYTSDPELKAALDRLIDRLSRRKDLVHKLTQHPTRSQRTMVQILEQECSEFLVTLRKVNVHAWSHVWLYRGQRGSASVLEGRSRIDRTPKDSRSDLSDLLDEHLENMGFHALRRNSIFTTTQRSFAKDYGDNLYLIFPKNGFHFLWTSQKDLVMDSIIYLADQDLVRKYMTEVQTWLTENKSKWGESDHNASDLANFLSWPNVSDTIRLVHDMSMEDTYEVPAHLIISQSDLVTDHSVKKQFRPQQTDLEAAMHTDHEILINGTYWALRADLWEDYLHHALIQPD